MKSAQKYQRRWLPMAQPMVPRFVNKLNVNEGAKIWGIITQPSCRDVVSFNFNLLFNISVVLVL